MCSGSASRQMATLGNPWNICKVRMAKTRSNASRRLSDCFSSRCAYFLLAVASAPRQICHSALVRPPPPPPRPNEPDKHRANETARLLLILTIFSVSFKRDQYYEAGLRAVQKQVVCLCLWLRFRLSTPQICPPTLRPVCPDLLETALSQSYYRPLVFKTNGFTINSKQFGFLFTG